MAKRGGFPGMGMPGNMNNLMKQAQKMLMEYSVKEERFFRHFKGGMYKYIHSAYDSETQERMESNTLNSWQLAHRNCNMLH